MRSALVAAALLLSACELTAVQDADAKLELLRRLAESSYGAQETHHAERPVFSPSVSGKQDAQHLPPRPSTGDSAVLVATVRSQLSNFGSNWRKNNMAEAATALRQAGSALSQLQQEVQQHDDPAASIGSRSAGSALAAIANTCSEYAGYLLFDGMEDGSHADWPRLVEALFSTLWALAELSGRWVVETNGASAGLAAWMKPGDLRTFAKAVVSAASRDRRLQPQTVLLVRRALLDWLAAAPADSRVQHTTEAADDHMLPVVE